jgi:hypothetical protein
MFDKLAAKKKALDDVGKFAKAGISGGLKEKHAKKPAPPGVPGLPKDETVLPGEAMPPPDEMDPLAAAAPPPAPGAMGAVGAGDPLEALKSLPPEALAKLLELVSHLKK